MFTLRRSSRLLILVILLAGVVTSAVPVHAAVSITLSSTAVNAAMGTVTSIGVTITNTDLVAHSITLSLLSGGGVWPGYFSPNPVNVAASSSAISTLTLSIPGPNDICPGTTVPGPYILTFTVQGVESSTVLATASLLVNLLSAPYGFSVGVTPSKQSYRIGETISISMTSNPYVPAQYYMRVKKPDGTIWGSASGYLPATYTKTAAQPIGTYSVELTAYYCGTSYATASFAVTPNTYDVTVSIAGLPGNLTTSLLIDGNKVADLKGGDVRVVSEPIGSSHTFQVDQYVNGPEGYRYYASTNSYTAGSEGSFTFNYISQFYVDVRTDPGNVTDLNASGWFTGGSQATIPAVPTEVEGSAGAKYVFKTWTVGGSPVSGNGFPIGVNGPLKIVAVYETQYQLVVDSAYGSPQGAGYYPAGATATYSVTTPVGFLVQQVFAGWEGDASGTDPQGSIVMDRSHLVRAKWTTSYVQLYALIAAAAVLLILGLLVLRRRKSRAGMITKPTPETAPLEGEELPPTETPSETATEAVATTCTSCGAEVAAGKSFCENCGAPVSKPDEA